MTPRFERKPGGTRDPLPWLIIAVEGKTEEVYFHELRVRHRLPEGRVRILREGSAPVSVVDCAIRKAKEARANKSDRNGQAWAVFDGEEHQGTVGQRHGWNDALQRAASSEVNVAVSNPSFELWLLLHFQGQTANLHRDQAAQLLNAGMGPGYAKGQPILDRLKDRGGDEVEAIRRAEHLLEREQAQGTGPHGNPSTRAHLVVADLVRLRQAHP